MLVGNMIASWEDIHLPTMTCTSAPGPQEWQTESNFSQSEKVPTCQWYKVPDKDIFENQKNLESKVFQSWILTTCYSIKSLFMNNGVKVVDDNGDCMNCAQGLVNIVTKYSIWNKNMITATMTEILRRLSRYPGVRYTAAAAGTVLACKCKYGHQLW